MGERMKIERPWGYVVTLYDSPKLKVKELVIEPGKTLTMQKHNFRNEAWRVVEGVAFVKTWYPRIYTGKDETFEERLYEHHEKHIAIGVWHQLSNPGNDTLRIIETQYGETCSEEDVERKFD